ncbi:MAG: prepilin-type N-terminal cleavage/methylation domain-containing protein [Patescibacteria group bacterium]
MSTVTKKGFTLIELLVVISLIGVLAVLVLPNLNAARERGRDAARKSDLKNMQTALRLYYNDYGKYPMSTGAFEISGCGVQGTDTCLWGLPFEAASQTYMNKLPADPLNVPYRYTRIDADTYTLDACLENKSDDKAIVSTGNWCPSGVMFEIKP